MDLSKTPGSREGTEPAPVKLFPQWRTVEQDFWLDMFETYSETLLCQVPEEGADLKREIEQAGTPDMSFPERRDTYFVDKIQLAAKLADEATKEMIYRFERQKPVSTRPRRGNGGRDDRFKQKRRQNR